MLKGFRIHISRLNRVLHVIISEDTVPLGSTPESSRDAIQQTPYLKGCGNFNW